MKDYVDARMSKDSKEDCPVDGDRFCAQAEQDRMASDASARTVPTPTVDAEVLRSALADLEEAKRRVRRDAERQVELLRAQVLETLLPVLDNLERSVSAAAGSASVDGLLNGVKLVHAQFLAVLAQFGLARRSALGERFDPHLHDAVAVVPVIDTKQDGVVVSELEPAYVIGERVIRPAKVQVGRAADRPAS